MSSTSVTGTLAGAKVAAQKMTIAKGHQLQCFAGLGKQPLRGRPAAKACFQESGGFAFDSAWSHPLQPVSHFALPQ